MVRTTGEMAVAVHGAAPVGFSTGVRASLTVAAACAPSPNDRLTFANHARSRTARPVIDSHAMASATGNQGKLRLTLMTMAGPSLPPPSLPNDYAARCSSFQRLERTKRSLRASGSDRQGWLVCAACALEEPELATIHPGINDFREGPVRFGWRGRHRLQSTCARPGDRLAWWNAVPHRRLRHHRRLPQPRARRQGRLDRLALSSAL